MHEKRKGDRKYKSVTFLFPSNNIPKIVCQFDKNSYNIRKFNIKQILLILFIYSIFKAWTEKKSICFPSMWLLDNSSISFLNVSKIGDILMDFSDIPAF